MKLREAMELGATAADTIRRWRDATEDQLCVAYVLARLRAEVNRLTARLDAAEGALAQIAGMLTDAEPDIAAPDGAVDITAGVERVIAQRDAHMIVRSLKRDGVTVPRELLLRLADHAETCSIGLSPNASLRYWEDAQAARRAAGEEP